MNVDEYTQQVYKKKLHQKRTAHEYNITKIKKVGHVNLSFFKTSTKEDGGHCNQFPISILLLAWQTSQLATTITLLLTQF